MSTRFRPSLPLLVLVCAVVAAPALAKPKKKPADAKPAGDAPSELPSNLNLASLRVAAMQTLYELDASPQQVRAVRAAAGAVDRADRPVAGKPPEKLAKAVRDLRDALVGGPDDAAIAAARNALVDAAGDADPPLDDEVHPTAAARAKAAALVRTFSASQLAAYLAAHADQVPDPAERLVAGLAEAAEDDAAVDRLSADVAQLVAGDEAARGKVVASKAADWLRANKAAGVPETAEARARLEASAKAVVGDSSPVEVLGHWFEDEMATLLSNPQLPEAADAMVAARQNQH